MLNRCYDEMHRNYERYGGRGIMCAMSGETIINSSSTTSDQPPASHYTVDRIDNDKGYQPGNVRWATRIEQQANARRIEMQCPRCQTVFMGKLRQRFCSRPCCYLFHAGY